MQKTGDIVLHPHQEEAVEAIVRGLDIPPGKRIPEAGLRATVVAACGTGKTFTAAAAALRLARGGRVLVLLPILDLLTQTVREWRAAGHTGPAVAVCSLEDDVRLWSMDVRTTTSAPQLGLWHGRGPVTVYATYASLPVIAEAHRGEYGLPMDVFDLVVVDEAHRTSGSAGKAWADVHHQEVIAAMRRLYMTATPRIWAERPPRSREQEELYEAQVAVVDEETPGQTRRVWDRLPRELACSMDDEKVFGPVVYELSLADAISRGLLAKYQVVVVELTDPLITRERLVGEERYEEQLRGERLAAMQTALLEAMTTHDLKTTITFHHRTIEAQAFAEGLPRVAARLHQADPVRYPAPERVWSGWLCGDHDSEHRQEVIGAFGRRVGRAVLANCKVLGEGVDIRAVDSVALIDPRGSAVDIVQAIGRALRQKPGEGKMATLLVPVFLAQGEKPEDILSSKSYGPVIRVLEGLRAHDERAVETLAIPQEAQKRVVQPSLPIGQAPAEGQEETRLILRFAAHRDPALIAKWVSYLVLNTERQDWRRGIEAALRYRQREHHLEVPYDHLEGSYPLGRWLSDQRRVFRAGQMSGERAAELEGLGIVWDTADAGFEENLGAARAYFAEHGTLAAPRHATALDRAVGQWLTNIRRPGGLGKDPDRARRRAEQLAAVDPDWNPRELGWTVDWQRHYAYLAQLLAAGARVEDVVPGVTLHGENVGRWLTSQRRNWDRLNEEQRRRLGELGVKKAVRARKAAAKAAPTSGPGKGGEAFQKGLEALAQYIAQEGGLPGRAVVQVLPDGSEHRTGIWIGNQKQRRDRLDAAQLAALADLGMDWAQ
ncbi:DEAD/DEAH box helicase [Streptomyces sp. ISL-94]|uniref:DEAD/DEAH box helicase n=1 Tax=Streptomyces sp. ISL-94 TaxID=2819190 RepID=UPI001BE60D76|nr:DEAD/DEAH box helicase [Streptomyces sp. ISL-94]MBT2479571.1 Helicase associated domain protein [Streptomyces sp. ISL-94]